MKSNNTKISIALFVVMLVSLLTGTFAWYVSNSTAKIYGVLAAGSHIDVILSDGAISSAPYNGQLGYDNSNNIYTNDDAPYFAQFDISFKAVGSKDIKVKYLPQYCAIAVNPFFGWDSVKTIQNLFDKSFDASQLDKLNHYL